MPILIFFFSLFAASQANSQSHFRENKGQWPREVLFQMPLSSGAVYIQKDGFVFSMLDVDDLEYNNYLLHRNEPTETVKGHAWKMAFVNCNENFGVEKTGKSREYYNYFLGNDESRWASKVHGFEEVLLTNVWDRIDVRVYRKSGKGKQVFKYDFIVHPGGNPGNIKLEVTGDDELKLQEGKVVLETSVGQFKETLPFSYQGNKEVKSAWRKDGAILSFEVGDYNVKNDLIIDPELVAASYLGAHDVLGFGATYLEDGSFFSSGRTIDAFFPNSIGAFQIDYGGGLDVALTKWNTVASEILWSSYLGGDEEERIANMAANNSGELFVLLFTESTNFPTTENIIKNSFPGTIGISAAVSKISEDGTTLINSTFIEAALYGGVSHFNDFNYVGSGPSADIILDNLNRPIICFSVFQPEIVFEDNAFLSSLTELSGIALMRISENLSTILNGTYLESNNDIGARSLVINSNGEIILAGNTKQSNINEAFDLPTTSGAYLQSSPDPENDLFFDGFIAKFSSEFNTLNACTVVSSIGPDRIWNLALDNDDDIWVLGLTEGELIVIENGYYDANSPLFIAEFESDLSNMSLCTSVGTGDGFNSGVLVPTAFMVDNCDRVYFSAHGNYLPLEGLNLSETPYQSQGGFFLAQFEPEMSSLAYGTLLGGDHTDGSRSEFDPRGIVYQTVCSFDLPPNNPRYFNTLPNAWSSVMTSETVELAVFKFDFQSDANVSAFTVDDLNPCANAPVLFTNHSSGQEYNWLVNGEVVANSTNLEYSFPEVGTYEVSLQSIHPEACNTEDVHSITLTIEENNPMQLNFEETDPFNPCENDLSFSLLNTTSNADESYWINPEGEELNTENLDWEIIIPGEYTLGLVGYNAACEVRDTLFQTFEYEFTSFSADLPEIEDPCLDYLQYSASTSGINFEQVNWYINDTLFLSTDQGSIVAFDMNAPANIVLSVEAIDSTCNTVETASILLELQGTLVVNANYSLDNNCEPASVELSASSNYGEGFWQGSLGEIEEENAAFNNIEAGNYALQFIALDSATCNIADTLNFEFEVLPSLQASYSLEVLSEDCADEAVVQGLFTGQNATEVLWDLGNGDQVLGENLLYTYTQSGNYSIEVSMENAPCNQLESAVEEVQLELEVALELQAPNIITPNGDGKNEQLRFFSADAGIDPELIGDVSLEIYNRWGQLLEQHKSIQANINWNAYPDGVYFYILRYTDECSGETKVLESSLQVVR